MQADLGCISDTTIILAKNNRISTSSIKICNNDWLVIMCQNKIIKILIYFSNLYLFFSSAILSYKYLTMTTSTGLDEIVKLQSKKIEQLKKKSKEL